MAVRFELAYPVGLRAAKRLQFPMLNGNLTREQALLREQELRISHDLSNASRQMIALINCCRQTITDKMQTACKPKCCEIGTEPV